MEIKIKDNMVMIDLKEYAEIKTKAIGYNALLDMYVLPKNVITTTEKEIQNFYNKLLLMNHDVDEHRMN